MTLGTVHHDPALAARGSDGPGGSESAAGDHIAAAVEALRQIDRHHAALLRAVAAARPEGGMPAERLISLAARATGWDIAFVRRAVDVLDAMPGTWQAFDDGQLSWSQLRGIVQQARTLRSVDRQALDHLLATAIRANDVAEPDRLVDVAADLVTRLDEASRQQREQAECAQSFIRFQPRLFGGVDFWGHADDETAATLVAALDAAADAPVADDDIAVDDRGQPIPAAWRRGTARGAQLIEALRRIAAAYQPASRPGRTAGTAGRGPGRRTRPRRR